MREHLKRLSVKSEHGFNMLEVLVVASIIGILVTVPIAAMRDAKTKVYEMQAIGALNMMAVAYESYNNETNPQRYPNYLRSGDTSSDLIDFGSAEDIWDELLRRKFIPRRYSLYDHDTPNLLANGYRLSIYPFFASTPSFSASPRYTYAIGMVPIEGSRQKRVIAIFQGNNGQALPFLSPRARKLDGTQAVGSARFYTWKDF